jgi:Zn-dependent protease
MERVVSWPFSWETVLLLPALFAAFTVHELAHAAVAFVLGDTSQVERRRLSFNPLRHVSWLGMAAFLLLRIGWAKPMWVDPSRFRTRHPALGTFLVSIAGSAANLVTALVAAAGMVGTMTVVMALTGASLGEVLAFVMGMTPGPTIEGLVLALSSYMVLVNLVLAFFNLLPLPFLDGFQALTSLYVLVRDALRGGPAAAGAMSPAAAAMIGGLPEGSPAQIHFTIGLQYQQEGQWDEAIARYRQALTQDRELCLAYYNLGVAYWAKGRPNLAANAFQGAMRCRGDGSVRGLAEQRLRQLGQAAQGRRGALGPVPAFLAPGDRVEAPEAPPALDATLVRRVWLRLAVGATVALLATAAAWVFVTVAVLQAMMVG